MILVTLWSESIAGGAQLGNDAKSAVPRDVMQVIVVDYRAMQNSSAAMSLKAGCCRRS